MRILMITGLLMLVIGALAGTAFADGETRVATPAETGFGEKVTKALADAMPQAVKGWTEISRTAPQDWKYVSAGVGSSPLYVSFYAGWEDTKKLEESDQKAAKEAEGAVQKGAFNSPDMPALMKQVTELSEKLGKAAEKGDMAETQRIQEQLKPIQERLEAIGSSQEKMVKEMEKRTRAVDASARVSFFVNRLEEDLSNGAFESDLEWGKVYRVEPGEDDTNEGTTYVFLGKWKQEKESDFLRMKAEIDPSKPHTTVQSILIEVNASKSRPRERLGAINWKALKSLL